MTKYALAAMILVLSVCIVDNGVCLGVGSTKDDPRTGSKCTKCHGIMINWMK